MQLHGAVQRAKQHRDFFHTFEVYPRVGADVPSGICMQNAHNFGTPGGVDTGISPAVLRPMCPPKSGSTLYSDPWW